ncbi:MAG: hypothetical protein OHK0029_37200 [Armatimonadaceae bacterium]
MYFSSNLSLGKKVIKALTLIACIGISGTFSSAVSAQVAINATDRGWHRSDGQYLAGNLNYVVGNSAGNLFRNFFVFSIPALQPGQTYFSAQLRLFNPAGGFSSGNLSETYTLYNVSTPISTLLTNKIVGGAAGVNVYNDLGSGTAYGTRVFSSADNGQFVVINLNTQALAAINNAAGGQIAIGGAFTTLDGNNSTVEQAFALTQNEPLSATQLIVTATPEPDSLFLMLLSGGAVTIFASVKRQRKRYETASCKSVV